MNFVALNWFNIFLLNWMVILLSCCTTKTDNFHKVGQQDTTTIIQHILSDKQLESELLKDFGNQQLKLVAGSVSPKTQHLIFAGQPIRIVSVEGDIYQIHQQHPREFYVSVPEVTFFPNDSAVVLLIFHSGNATARFNLKKSKGQWTIKQRQYGKF